MIRIMTNPSIAPSTRRRLSAGALTLAAAVMACNIAFASDEAWDAREEITKEEIQRDLTWLAHDEREGRSITSEGINEAADYIAERFESLGLAKLDGLDGYFQPFDFPFGRELKEDATSLKVGDDEGLAVGKDFMPMAWSAAREFEGELVFAGYGINSEQHNYNDYADLDVQGKVVLVLNYEPYNADGKSRFTNTERPSREGRLFSKANAAQEAGAVALLVVTPLMHQRGADELMEFGRGSSRTEIPVIHVTQSAAAAMLRKAGLPPLRRLQQEIDEGGAPVAHEPKEAVTVSGGFTADDRTIPIKNVVGVVEGKKADEFIVVGAHYDHVGNGEYGSSYGRAIHNGADDNGSGTTTVLALAEAFARSPEKPERSIIFMAFTAEELGLVGSRHFSDNPPIPLAQIVAMVNLDMVGRVREDKLFVGGWNSAAVFDGILKSTDENSPLVLEDMGDAFSNRSDHYSFMRHKIPAVFFFSGLHEEYHSPDDDAHRINFDGMELTAELVFDVIRKIDATPREELAFQEAQPREMMNNPTTRQGRRAEDTN